MTRPSPAEHRTDDPPVLLCPPITTIPAVTAVVRYCGDCLTEVWVSLTMAPAVDEGLPPCCFACMNARADAAAEVHPPMFHPLQRAAGMTDERFAAIAAGVLHHLQEFRHG